MSMKLDDIQYDEDEDDYPWLHVSFRTSRNSL